MTLLDDTGQLSVQVLRCCKASAGGPCQRCPTEGLLMIDRDREWKLYQQDDLGRGSSPRSVATAPGSSSDQPSAFASLWSTSSIDLVFLVSGKSPRQES